MYFYNYDLFCVALVLKIPIKYNDVCRRDKHEAKWFGNKLTSMKIQQM